MTVKSYGTSKNYEAMVRLEDTESSVIRSINAASRLIQTQSIMAKMVKKEYT